MVAHDEPAQHGWLLPPQVPQVPPEQTSVDRLQVVPQQGCPVPPHAVHLPVAAQVRLDPHGVAPAQHGWLLAPQAVQLPPEHTVPDAEHELPQQGWVAPPQATHMLLEQVAPFEHTVPQHGCPAAPHAAQVPFAPQTAPVLQVVPQHGWFTPPQAEHLFAEHWYPVAQLEPAQHG